MYSEEDEDEDCFDSDEDEDEGQGQGGEDNPFAAADVYLSDLIDMSMAGGSGSGGRGGHVYIPDTLMFPTARLDPLFVSVPTKQRLQEVVSRHQDPEGRLAE